jgi:hypothetical protein
LHLWEISNKHINVMVKREPDYHYLWTTEYFCQLFVEDIWILKGQKIY